jgi:hypothetical protein
MPVDPPGSSEQGADPGRGRAFTPSDRGTDAISPVARTCDLPTPHMMGSGSTIADGRVSPLEASCTRRMLGSARTQQGTEEETQ